MVHYIVVKKTKTVSEIEFTRYRCVQVDCICLEEGWYSGVHVGDRLRIVRGRKHPIGTEGVVKLAIPSKYETKTFYNRVTGDLLNYNPFIVLTLDDGTEIATSGKNCINITDEGLEGIHEFDTDAEAKEWISATLSKYPLPTRDCWRLSGASVTQTGYSIYGLGTQSYSIYKGMVKETENEVAAVIDDFHYDVYYFVRFSKKAEAGNLIEMVATGTHRNMDDMWRGDTGLGDAIKAFEEFKAA